jgi:SAM-dependent methyltransferase
VSDSHFDHIAGEYDSSLPAHVVEHYLRKRVAYIRRNCPSGRLLDVGCGTGTLARRLSAAGYEVTGVDPSEGMLSVMRAADPSVAAVRGSGTSLPFEAASFDVVVTVAVMHHVADPAAVRAMLGEMVRVLRPGGRVIVWDHNPRNLYWHSLMSRVPQDTGEERLIPERELVIGLELAGARILECRQLGWMPDFVPAAAVPGLAALEQALELTPGIRRLGAHNVVLAGARRERRGGG